MAFTSGILFILGALLPLPTMVYGALAECGEMRGAQILTLFDATSRAEIIARQRVKLEKVLRHIETRSGGQDRVYGLFAFHETPVLLTTLDQNADEIVKNIDAVKGSRDARRNISEALRAAASHFRNFNAQKSVSRIVLLVVGDGGVQDDEENRQINDAIEELRELGAEIFVVSGADAAIDDKNASSALAVYTSGRRERIFVEPSDVTRFFEALNRKINVCFEEENGATIRAARSQRVKNAVEAQTNTTCGSSNRLDLMLVLDTSGSITNSFLRERQLLAELIEAIDERAFIDQRIQVGILRFAAEPTLVLPLAGGRKRARVLDAVRAVRLTGRVTHIADALGAAVTEMEQARRVDALQLFVLISDGHGQEYWSSAQEAGTRLRATGALVYAASTSFDYNAAELALYVGDRKRVFVGPAHKRFVPQLSNFINTCLKDRSSNSSKNMVDAAFAQRENEAVQMAKTEFAGLSDPFQEAENRPKIFELNVNGTAGEKLNGTAFSTTTNETGVWNSGNVEEDLKPDTAFVDSSSNSKTSEANGETEIINITEQDLLNELTGEVLIGSFEFLRNDTEDKVNGREGQRIIMDNKADEIKTSKGSLETELKAKIRTTIGTSIKGTSVTNQENGTDSVEFVGLNKVEIAGIPEQLANTLLDGVKLDKAVKIEAVEVKKIEESPAKNEPRNLESVGANSTKSMNEFSSKLDENLAGKSEFGITANSLIEDFATTLQSSVTNGEDFISGSIGSEINSTTTLDSNTVESPVENAPHIFKWPTSGTQTSDSNVNGESAGLSSGPKLGNRASEFISADGILADHRELSSSEIAEVSQRLQNHQNLSRLPEDCATDMVLIVDRATPAYASFDFGEQLDALAGLVYRVADADFDAKRVRVAIVSFGKTATLETSLSKATSKKELIRRLMQIRPIRAHSSFAKAIQLTNQEIRKYRRSTARLLVFVVWSGLNGRDTNQEIDESLKMLLRFPVSETYALTFNPRNRVERLAKLAAGDKFAHVFVEARASFFVERAAQALIACVLPPSADLRVSTSQIASEMVDAHAPLSSVERVEHLQSAAAQILQRITPCPNDELDLVLLMDITSLAALNASVLAETSGALRRAALDVLKQSIAADFATGRVRVALLRVRTTTSSHAGEYVAQSTITLADALLRDDALFAVERLALETPDHVGVEWLGLDMVLASDVRAQHRERARLAFIVFTELSLADETGKALLKQVAQPFRAPDVSRASRPSILALSLHNDIFGELNGRDSQFRMFKDRRSGSGYHRFIKETRRKIFACQLTRLDGATASDNDDANSVVARRLRDDPLEAVTSRPVSALATFGGTRFTRITVHPTVTYDLNESHPRVVVLDSDYCKVDLVFVIDTSQSVAEEFQRQLQFAVDLINRLPDEDFISRVRIAVISFNSTALVVLPLAEPRDKPTVLAALRSIAHTGGSTSTVSGVERAVVAASGARRVDARLMIVLISDGNSQDEWERVLTAAERLRALKADVYAVTVSQDYFFRELEIYAGNKWFVYIDARIRQFLDEAEKSVMECRNPRVPATASSASSALESGKQKPKIADSKAAALSDDENAKADAGQCEDDPVNLLLILDTSSSVEKEFYAQKNFALELIKVLPEADFKNRIRVALVKFNAVGERIFGFEPHARNDILYEIERVAYAGGQTSLAAGADAAVAELRAVERRRANSARTIVVLISDGNSQDAWPVVQAAAGRLRDAVKSTRRAALSEVYAVTLSTRFYFDELREYANSAARIYAEQRVADFIQEVGHTIISCQNSSNSSHANGNDGGANGRPKVEVTLAPNAEVSQTPASARAEILAEQSKNSHGGNVEFSRRLNAAALVAGGDAAAFSRDATPQISSEKCRNAKMDLIIILDASTSREAVFEQQRELALSLVERLPIAPDDTHVAVGINSFTNVPVLRQTLGLGRERKMVRKAIENIKYRGGSTLTSKAVELAVQDLERGRRSDAIQVVVLMNDGMSQDLWERVLSASAALEATRAERFGVALGDEVDLRELRRYIGDESRIYRNNSTERFLNDVISLLGASEKECAQPEKLENQFNADDEIDTHVNENDQIFCTKSKLDILVLFDNSDTTPNLTDAKINANRYLLLDVLGSLPLKQQVQVAIHELGARPQLVHQFSDAQDHDAVFAAIEHIKPARGRAAYARGVADAIDYFETTRRADACALALLVGGAQNVASADRSAAVDSVRRSPGLTVLAVDSAKDVNVPELVAYTGSAKNVFNYTRNSDFANSVIQLARQVVQNAERSRANSATEVAPNSASNQRARISALRHASARVRDLGTGAIDAADAKLFGVPDALKKIAPAAVPDKIVTRRPIVSSIVPIVLTSRPTTISPDQLPEALAPNSNGVRGAIDSRLFGIERARSRNATRNSLKIGSENSAQRVAAETRTTAKLIPTDLSPSPFEFGKDANNEKPNASRMKLGQEIGRIRIEVVQSRHNVSSNGVEIQAHRADRNDSNILLKNEKKKRKLREKSEAQVRLVVNLQDRNSASTKAQTQKSLTQTGRVLGRGDLERKTQFPPAEKTASEPLKATKGPQQQVQQIARFVNANEASRIRQKQQQLAGGQPQVNRGLVVSNAFLTSASTSTPSSSAINAQFGRAAAQPQPQQQQKASFLSEADLHKAELEDARPYRPGCLVDLIVLIDASGSVESAFEREKSLVANVISLLRVGANNTRVALIKFAATEKVRTVHGFGDSQTRASILRALADSPFSSGVTAIHSALLQAIAEYTPARGARPGLAAPMLLIVTDGFAQSDVSEAARLLRRVIPDVYAVAVDDERITLSRAELARITGDARRVFTDATVGELHKQLRAQYRTC